MTVLLNTFEGGTNGSEITAGNSGGVSGSSFAVSGTGKVYSTTGPMHDSMCALFTVASGASVYAQWSIAANNTFAGQLYFRNEAVPTATSPFWVWRGGGAQQLVFAVKNDGALVLQNAISGTLWTSPAPLSLATWYRLDVWGDVDTATTGELHFDYYLGDGTTPISTGFSSTTVNLGVNPMDTVRFGAHGTTASARTHRFDSIRAADGQAAYFTPYGINVPPSVDAGADQGVAAGATVNLSATITDSDGTINTIAWTFDYPTSGAPSLTGASTATPSFTAGSAGAYYLLRCTATDNDTESSYDTVVVKVLQSGTLRPVAIDDPAPVGTWTKAGGATTHGGALSDESDSTYDESATATSTEQKLRIPWQGTPGRSSAQMVVRVAQDVAGTLIAKARLIEGSTVRQEWTLTTTTTIANQTLTLDSGTIAAITNWNNLFLEFSAAV